METGRINKIIFYISFLLLLPSFSFVYAGTLSKPANNLGLVGYWSFNDATSTQATDFSGRGNTGVLNTFSAPATASSGWGLGKFGSALKFDGSSDYVAINGVADDVTSTSFAVSTWVKCSANGDYTVWGTNNSTASQNKTGLFIDTGGNLYVWDGSNEAAEITGSVSMCNNAWHHTVYTRTGSTGTLYIDGVSQGTHTAGDTFASNDLWAIGVEWEPGLALIFYLNGSIDDFRVYNRPLSGTEVLNLYNSGLLKVNSSQNNLLRDGLVTLFSFDGGDISSNISYDRSGTSNNGTILGTTKVLGKIGQALSFDGVDDYITFNGVANDVSHTSFAFSAWIKSSFTSGFDTVVAINTSGLGNQTQLFIDNTLTVRVYDGTDDSTELSSLGSVVDGNWHHVVYTRTGSTGTLYVDGVSQGTHTSSDTFSGTDLWSLGQEFDAGPTASDLYQGLMDDVRFYNRSLTINDVKTLYNAGIGSKINSSQNVINGSSLQTGLVGMWSFNGLDLTDQVYDRSGNGNNGYVYNGATSTMKAPGKVGQGLLFDGSTNYLNMGSPASLDDLPSLSYSFWIKPRSAGNGRGTIVAKTDPFSAFGLRYVYFDNVTATNGISILIDTTATDIGYTSANNSAPLNQWTHAVVTWDGSVGNANNVRIYINGVETTYQISDTGLGSLESDSGNNFTIGARSIIGSERYFDGIIDEVRVYNRVITPSEAKQLYLMGR